MKAEERRAAAVRRGEFTPLPGARARTRALPFPGCELPGADPWRSGYRRAGRSVRGRSGPSDPDAWIESLRFAPAGIVLVGPSPAGEHEPSAARAAVEALRRLGRGAVAIDVHFTGELPDPGMDLVFVSVWRSGSEAALWASLRPLARSFRAGVALPLLPGWTAREDFLSGFLGRAKEEGVNFVVPLEIVDSGISRAAIHEDFEAAFPDEADSYFDALHHGDWESGLTAARKRFPELAQSLGLRARVPRPIGRRDFAVNSHVIEALEARAETSEEPLAARLRAAARRIEDFSRDLAGLAAEGNLRLLFSAGTPEREVLDKMVETSGQLPA